MLQGTLNGEGRGETMTPSVRTGWKIANWWKSSVETQTRLILGKEESFMQKNFPSTMWVLRVSFTGRQQRERLIPAAWHPGRQSGYSQSPSHHSCSSTIQRLPHWLSCLANYHTNCLQHVESMRAHWAKISDHVAEYQEALNNSILLHFNGSFQSCSVHSVSAQNKQLPLKTFRSSCVLLAALQSAQRTPLRLQSGVTQTSKSSLSF